MMCLSSWLVIRGFVYTFLEIKYFKYWYNYTSINERPVILNDNDINRIRV